MIQKEYRKNKNAKKYSFIVGFLFLIFMAASSAGAQELTPVSVNSVGVNETLGTPVDEMISAATSGGLSGAQNISALKQDAKKPASESSIASDPSSDPQPTPPTPAFSSDSLKDLESQGGLSSAPEISSADTPAVFNLAVKFFEQVVFKKDVEFASRPMFDKGLDISGQPTFNKDTAGYAIIGKGNQSVEVDFDQAYDSPPVVTATLSLQQYKDPDVRAVAEDLLLVSDVKYIITNVSKKSFEIMMDHKADSDIPFSWHALAVNDPATANKKGEKLKSKIGNDLGPGNGGTAVPAAAGPAAVSQSNTSQAAGNTPNTSANAN
ncbi:MAG TPA: hypothetical protein VMQ48_02235 [Candidatus Saccharimonadales bacterium]|nr:hypothetical protein [Candidatus Saccharimonadales bacterium]